MSTYSKQTKHPITGEWHKATWIDDYYGKHNYGVQFPNSDIFDPEKTKLETRDDKPVTYTEKRFEDYLETVCVEANPSVLDDDMPDFFDAWLGNQDVEDMIRHCNNFLATAIHQAIAEDRKRVRGVIEKLYEEFSVHPNENDREYMVERFRLFTDKILSSLPLTDK